MTAQFPEHNEGKTSTNPKVQKLHKLAKSLHIEIQIDGVSYGEIQTIKDTPPVVVQQVSEYIGQHTIVDNIGVNDPIIDGLVGDPGVDGDLGPVGEQIPTDTLSIEEGNKLLSEILPTHEVDVTNEFSEPVSETIVEETKVEEKPKAKKPKVKQEVKEE